MMRYLVALGEERDEKSVKNNGMLVDVALKHAVAGRDCLLLARVIEEVKPDTAVVLFDILCDDDEQMQLENETRKKLEQYHPACVAAGVECAFVVLVNDHAGNALCKAVVEHNIDCMVMGRRDLGTLQRLISSSTSKYCVDNAECNVIVVKKPYQFEKTVEVTSQGQIIDQAERERRQMASEIPLPPQNPPRLFTLRDPTEMQKAFERSSLSPAEQSDPIPSAVPQKVQAKLQMSPRKREALAELSRQEEAERASRLPNKEVELAQELIARKAEMELVKRLEEEERDARVRVWNSQREIESRVRREESRDNLILTKKMEEEERNNRIEERKHSEIHENVASVKLMEEEERKQRVQARREESKQIEEESRKASNEDRLSVAKLEEEERALRISEKRKEHDKEAKQLASERAVSLERIHLAEEQERLERIRILHDEEVRERVETLVHSKEDRELARRMEAEEKARRMKEDADLALERKRESELDLLRVNQLEEIERAWRISMRKKK